MENVSCDLCGADNDEPLFVGQDEWHGNAGRFPTVRCQECGLIYITPRPDETEIGLYYPPSYQPYLTAIEDEPSWRRRFSRRLAMRKRLRLVRRYFNQPGRVLDVGCATGSFLAALRDAGWQTEGVEFSAYAADYARQRHGLEVTTGELADGRFPDGRFDLVIFWDVLEHIRQPRQTLQEAARIAKPGGALLLTLPNPDSLEARLFGQYWGGWDTPRHLYIFPLAPLRRMLAETGWEMREMRCISGRIWLFNLSLSHWLQNSAIPPRLQQLIMAVMRSLPMQIISLPFFVLLERLKKGSIMAIFAVRKE